MAMRMFSGMSRSYDFGSVLVHRDKFRALFPTTNSSVHLMAEPDGNETQTAYSSRTVSSMGRNCAKW